MDVPVASVPLCGEASEAVAGVSPQRPAVPGLPVGQHPVLARAEVVEEQLVELRAAHVAREDETVDVGVGADARAADRLVEEGDRRRAPPGIQSASHADRVFWYCWRRSARSGGISGMPSMRRLPRSSRSTCAEVVEADSTRARRNKQKVLFTVMLLLRLSSEEND
jgi:hypothetical protein